MGEPGEPMLLAAGSEFGNVHAWAVWRPQDGADAALAQAHARLPRRWSVDAAPPDGSAASEAAAGLATLSVERSVPRPHFARKLTCWRGHQPFVQSILLLGDGRVVSGGDTGAVVLHRIPPDAIRPAACHMDDAASDSSESPELDLDHASLDHDASGASQPLLLHPAGFSQPGASAGSGWPSDGSDFGHTAAVMCLGSSYDESTLYSGSVDETIRAWDLGAGGRQTGCFRGHQRSVHCLGVGKAEPYGPSVLFTGSRDHTIKLWDMRTHRAEHTLCGHTGSVTCLGTHGWKLLSGGGYNRGADDDEVLSVDSTLRLWDLRKLTHAAASPCVWTKHVPSPEPHSELDSEETDAGWLDVEDGDTESLGDPVLSLQLFGERVLTSHGGRRWTTRVWDL